MVTLKSNEHQLREVVSLCRFIMVYIYIYYMSCCYLIYIIYVHLLGFYLWDCAGLCFDAISSTTSKWMRGDVAQGWRKGSVTRATSAGVNSLMMWGASPHNSKRSHKLGNFIVISGYRICISKEPLNTKGGLCSYAMLDKKGGFTSWWRDSLPRIRHWRLSPKRDPVA